MTVLAPNFRMTPLVQPSSGAAGSDSFFVVQDIAELSALDDVVMDDGSVAAMRSVLDLWQLDKTATDAADGITVIIPASGTGRWLRMKIPSTHWQKQTTWFINATTGDDENPGSSSVAPLTTFAEWTRRVGTAPIGVNMTVTFAADTTEAIDIRAQTSQANTLVITGLATQIYAGSFTAVTVYDPASGATGAITDAAIPVSWTASGLVNKAIELTSGPNAGAIGWVAKDLGSKTARFSPFYDPSAQNIVSPTVGGTYRVISLTETTGALLAFANQGNITVTRLRFVGRTDSQVAQGALTIQECDIDGRSFTVTSSRLVMGGCRCKLTNDDGIVEPLEITTSRLDMFGSLNICGLSSGEGSTVETYDSIGQNQVGTDYDLKLLVHRGGNISIPSEYFYAVFDQTPLSSSCGLMVTPGGSAVIDGTFWGTGNATSYGVIAQSCGSIVYSQRNPLNYQTPTLAQALIGTSTSTYAALPVHDLSTGAAIVEAT